MTRDVATGNAVERELSYYRRECNDLGARLLRLQTEQSEAFRDARRSRTVVRLLREAYRLGDLAASASDVGAPMLEIIVETALCDRAAFLREEPVGSGCFLITQSIGLTEMNSDRTVVLDAVRTLAYTSGTRNDPTVEELARVLQLPYVLWAYDPTSGHALILGNRSETNINRPFEAGDQEFVEAALSIHLDVLRRKNDEAQLRQAKQRAEAATASRTALLTTLSQELRVSMQAVMALLEMFKTRSRSEEVWGEMDQHAAEIADSCSYLLALSEDAARVVGQDAMQPILNVGWVPLDNIVRSASRAEYAASVRRGVALTTLGCRRRTAVCVDTAQMQYALRRLTTVALRRTRSGGSVQITPSRRSDGAVEILIKSFSGPMGHVADTDALDSLHVQHLSPLDEYLLISRRIIEAHGGILTMEHVGEDDLQMRVILEAHLARDESLGVG